MEKASPIVKWVGGKRGIVDKLAEAMPEKYGDYWEPFVGGGALFLDLLPQQDGHKVHLSDINDDLITTYKAVKTSKNKVMARLDEHAAAHDEDYYYEVRGQHDLTDKVERAARFIFINKTGYNGLIRYNSKGEINTPWGHKANPVTLYDKGNMNAFAAALKGVELKTCSYTEICPKRGDFVYLDPPYHDTYNGYSKDGFGPDGQRGLAAVLDVLNDMEVYWMLSNSNTPFIRELYRGYNIAFIEAPRAVSCKGGGRKAVSEVIVRNY